MYALHYHFSLTGKGKCKAWDTWFNSENKDEYTTVSKELGNEPQDEQIHEIDE